MNTILKITVDPNSLLANISLNEDNESVVNELKLSLSGLSENYHFHDLQFSIPWYELRRGLSAIATLRKSKNIQIEYDTFTKGLIQEIVNDKKSVKNKIFAIDIDEVKFKNILQECGFARQLKDEQTRDALKVLKLKHGANFSVPGAGKTTTILAVHSILRHLGVVSKLFVISPINAFISWEDEIEDIFKDKKLKIERLHRSHLENISTLTIANPDVILVNYEKLRRDIGQLVPYFISEKIHMILDESHRVKSGMNNISYSQIIKLADLAKRRDILSGTPMPQSYLDLDPQFDFLWPGEKVIPENLNTKDDDTVTTVVNKSIEGLYARTTKKELGLNDPIIEYKFFPMGSIQSELYRLFKSETARIIAGIDKQNLYNFRRIGRSVVKLLQAATNPMLLTSKDEYYEETLPLPINREFWELLDEFQKYEKPIKIEYLKRRIPEIINSNPENKILIWSYFIRNILILEKIFMDYNPVTIYGGIPTGSDEDENTRENRIREFHENPKCKLMIANPQACGEGISLHKVCHYAIYLDRNFNAAYFLQSIDRIHRLGLDNNINTNIEILISENSIDEVLISRLNDKITAMGNILEDTYLHSLAYDPADIPTEDENNIDSTDFIIIKNHVNQK